MRLLRQALSTYDRNNDPIRVWRERIFFAVFLSGILFGVVSYISTLSYAITRGHFSISAIFYSVIYLCAIIILLVRRISFVVRVSVGLFLFYILGLATLLSVGPMGNAYIWLFAFAVTATLLLGLRAGLIAVGLNICTLIVFGHEMNAGHLGWLLSVPYTSTTWKTTSVTFAFLSCVIVISLAVLVRNLEKALKKEQALTLRLTAINEQLEQEIAERKRATNDLAESEEKYRTLFEDSLEPMSLTQDGKIVDVNAAWLEMHGFEAKKDVAGMNISDIIYPDDQKILLERRKRWPHYQDRLYELRDVRRDGSTVDVQVYSSKISIGKKTFILATVRDILKRKQAEEALQESEEKYRTILENIEEGYYEVDIKGHFTLFNDAFCKITGYSRDDLMDMDRRDLISPGDVEKVYQTFSEVYRTGQPVRDGEWRTLRPDGSERDMEASVSLVRSKDGRPIGFRGMIRDVTDRKLAEKNTKRLEAQIQIAQRLESLGTLAGGIAHDFNNILMGIQGRTSLMLMNRDASSDHLDHLQTIEDYVQSAADLTQQLLGLARGGKYEVRPVDLNDIVSKSSEMFGRTKKEISIHAAYQEDIWIVEADQRQIEQVLLNVYVNAWQAMPGGGDLYLETKNVTLDEPDSSFYQANPGRYVLISITDVGIGMDEETRQRIFDPFFTTKKMGRGTGLGLASAYGIIKNHGGFISVYSEKGHGSTFHIYLKATEKEAIKQKKQGRGIRRGSETVLLVDDEEMIIKVVKDLLEALGYTVFLAESGAVAIDIYREDWRKIDVVVLDMVMPGMSGSKTFDRLKQINPDIKIILSSGYSMDGEANEILKRGCYGFIQKPIKIAPLSQKLREVLDDRSEA
ncbi:MAG: PAS domain S-box protein [Deltaproteobacteria bacterium]|nr:PAS domain S-box protein [Deltaproteobacteria bacterium]